MEGRALHGHVAAFHARFEPVDGTFVGVGDGGVGVGAQLVQAGDVVAQFQHYVGVGGDVVAIPASGIESQSTSPSRLLIFVRPRSIRKLVTQVVPDDLDLAPGRVAAHFIVDALAQVVDVVLVVVDVEHGDEGGE